MWHIVRCKYCWHVLVRQDGRWCILVSLVCCLSSVQVLCRFQHHYSITLKQIKNCSLSLICMSFGNWFMKHVWFWIEKVWFCSGLPTTDLVWSCVYVCHAVDFRVFYNMCTVVFMLLFAAHQPMVPNVIDITCENENFLTDRKTHHETTSKMNVEGATRFR